MASYIHGTGAEKLAPSEREERLQRKRRQEDVYKRQIVCCVHQAVRSFYL